jgi:hypothetical protein
MLLKAVGAVMMVDGVLFAMAALPVLNTFVYRSLRDQSLVIAHFLVAVLLVTSGRMLLSADKRDRDSFSKNESRSLFALVALVSALAINAFELTRFDWLGFALRAVYTTAVLFVVFRARK